MRPPTLTLTTSWSRRVASSAWEDYMGRLAALVCKPCISAAFELLTLNIKQN